MTFDDWIKSDIALIEQGLLRYLPENAPIPPPLREAMRYSLFAGGKRIRPVLTLAANRLLRGDCGEALPYACAVEMIHTFSLVHDDLPAMDNDDLRRGRPTNHKVFGDGIALLAGDSLLNLAYEIMLKSAAGCAPERSGVHLKCIGYIARAAGVLGIQGGQCMDLNGERQAEMQPQNLIEIHRRKTSALMIAALQSGLGLCAPDEAEMQAIEAYGEHLGLAFQITDDLLNVTGDPRELGKPVGSDEKRSKWTYPRLFGLELARRMAREQVEAACESLSRFDSDTSFLRGVAQRLILRNH